MRGQGLSCYVRGLSKASFLRGLASLEAACFSNTSYIHTNKQPAPGFTWPQVLHDHDNGHKAFLFFLLQGNGVHFANGSMTPWPDRSENASFFFVPLYTRSDRVLPRQARDKHRKS